MGRRLALLAEGDHESPWTRANGSESAIRVKGLGGGRVRILVELKDASPLHLFFPEGDTSLQPYKPEWWTRYRVAKIVDGPDRILTTVEVLLDCSASH